MKYQIDQLGKMSKALVYIAEQANDNAIHQKTALADGFNVTVGSEQSSFTDRLSIVPQTVATLYQKYDREVNLDEDHQI